MKILAYQLVLIIGIAFPSVSSASELNTWLENLKREITRLGVNERGYLHSIGRVHNSVLQDEDLFFISAMHFEELDIRLLPDGNVQVSSLKGRHSKERGSGVIPRVTGLPTPNCKSVSGGLPRLSLIKASLNRSRGANNLSSLENNLLIYIENYIESLILGETNIALSPFFNNSSRYENLMRGSHFEDSKHKLLVRVEYDKSEQGSRWTSLNPKHWVSEEPRRHQISARIAFVDENRIVKEMTTSFSLLQSDLNSSRTIKQASGATDEMEELTFRVKAFLSELHCQADYSNSVVAVDGLLVLDSGTDAGLSQGDQFLLMPKSAYFRKRGLLSGVGQIAIARIKKINALQSELEIEEGKVRLEKGVEFFVRPLLELI